MSNASVSAVLFCFNEEKYIGKAIESLQKQTLALHKIIIVDDYSTDNTVQIVREYAQLDARIVIIENPYLKGKVSAYQKGLETVESDYFFVVGADDEVDVNLVEASITYISSLNQPFFFNSAKLINEKSEPLGRYFISSFNPISCYSYNKTGGLLFAHSSVIKNIIPFPNNLEFEDWYTVLKLFEIYGDIPTCTTPYVRYRIHSESNSQSSRLDFNRRKRLLQRDLKFLEIMLLTLQTDIAKAAIQSSINFRRKLLIGLPTLGSSLYLSKLYIKSYFSMTLARLVSLFK